MNFREKLEKIKKVKSDEFEAECLKFESAEIEAEKFLNNILKSIERLNSDEFLAKKVIEIHVFILNGFSLGMIKSYANAPDCSVSIKLTEERMPNNLIVDVYNKIKELLKNDGYDIEEQTSSSTYYRLYFTI